MSLTLQYPLGSYSDSNKPANLTLMADLSSIEATVNANETTLLALASLLNPIGTIREFNVATNPATLMGFGTWEAHGTGRVTVAISASDAEFDTLGETYGSKTHTLATAELPAHGHTFSGTTATNNVGHIHSVNSVNSGAFDGNAGYGLTIAGGYQNSVTIQGGGSGSSTGGESSSHTHAYSGTTANAGSGSAHNNIQPSIVVYRWVRTA